VVLSSIVVNLVNGHSGVLDGGLDGLLLDDRLDDLMDVVMSVLAGNDRGLRVGVCGGAVGGSVLELGGLLLELLLDGRRVTVVVLTVLDGSGTVLVLLGKNLTVLNGLDGGVVVVLVDLTVDGTSHVLVVCLVDSLLCDSRGDGLVDGGVMLASTVHEVRNGSLSLVHCECETGDYWREDLIFGDWM